MVSIPLYLRLLQCKLLMNLPLLVALKDIFFDYDYYTIQGGSDSFPGTGRQSLLTMVYE